MADDEFVGGPARLLPKPVLTETERQAQLERLANALDPARPVPNRKDRREAARRARRSARH